MTLELYMHGIVKLKHDKSGYYIEIPASHIEAMKIGKDDHLFCQLYKTHDFKAISKKGKKK